MYKVNFLINLNELKLRSVYFLISFVLLFIVNFNYSLELVYLSSKFFLDLGQKFIYTSLLDPLYIYLKLSFFYSLIFVQPVFFYLFIYFFLKGFNNFYVLYLFSYSLIIYFLTLLGFLVISFFCFPFLFKFLLNFQLNNPSEELNLILQATIVQYFNFYLFFIYFYILISILFVFLFFLVFFGIISPQTYFNYTFRKYLYGFFFVIFLLIAPPDFFMQIFLLPFFILFFEIYIFVNTFFLVFRQLGESRIRTYDEI